MIISQASVGDTLFLGPYLISLTQLTLNWRINKKGVCTSIIIVIATGILKLKVPQKLHQPKRSSFIVRGISCAFCCVIRNEHWRLLPCCAAMRYSFRLCAKRLVTSFARSFQYRTPSSLASCRSCEFSSMCVCSSTPFTCDRSRSRTTCSVCGN